MGDIGIVGGGVGGLHLALYLQQHGVDAVLYAEKTPEEQRAGRLPNTAAHWASTRARERELQVNHWDGPYDVQCFHIRVYTPDPLVFQANHADPGICVDQRMFLARLQEDFAERGGTIKHGAIQAGDLEPLSEQHDLVVLSTGRGSLTDLFPRMPEHSPYTKPQRVLCTGLYEGITFPQPYGVSFSIAPTVAELFELPYQTFDGTFSSLFFECNPDGPLGHLVNLHYDDDPPAFETEILKGLEQHFPATRERIDTGAFKLHRPLDLLQGAITPTFRRAYGRLPNGHHVLAMGDVHVVQDPLLGQGSNSASAEAFIVGRAIVDELPVYDERFLGKLEARMVAYQADVTAWNNAFLQMPPPFGIAPHAVQFLICCAQNQAVADTLATNFAYPDRAWDIFATPERTRAFLHGKGCQTPLLDAPGPAPDGG
jgi:2-polyprenyl-6-methoxyphenol hydroxylase-like FAD-dependent oxidoreductase